MINNENSIQLPQKCSNKALNDDFVTQWNQNTSSFIWLPKWSKFFGTSSNIFGNIWKPSENHRKSSEVTGTFSEIPSMTRQKSHAFDPEKVGRYTGSKNNKTVILILSKAIIVSIQFLTMHCDSLLLSDIFLTVERGHRGYLMNRS